MRCVLAIVFCGFSFTSHAQADCELREYTLPACDDMASFSLLSPDQELADAIVLNSSGVNLSYNFSYSLTSFTFTDISFTNYRGYGSFTVRLELTDGTVCEVEVKVVECCSTNDYDLLFVDETIPVQNYFGEVIWIYGDVEIDASTSFTANDFFMATDAQLTFNNNVSILFEECSFTKLCEYAWDRILLDASGKEATFANCSVDNALRGVFCTNDATLNLEQSVLASNKISLYIEDYTTDAIVVNGCSFEEIQDVLNIVQHPSSTIVMTDYFPQTCADIFDQTAPVVVKNSADVHIGDQNYTTNTFSNNNVWANDNTFINVNNSQVYIRNNTFNITATAVCSYGYSKVIMGGSAAEANTVYAAVDLRESSFQLKSNTFESNVSLTNVDYTIPAAGLSAGGEVLENTFTGENSLSVNQNGENSYLRIFDNQFTDYRMYFDNFPLKSNGRLIFHSNTLKNLNYNPQSAIYVSGCHQMTFSDNYLEGSFPGTPEGTATNMGIWFVETENVQIANNQIRYFNRGLNLEGDNSGTEVLCNAFLNNYYHVYLDNTLIAASQGSQNASHGNCFSEIYAQPNPYSGEKLFGTSTQMGTSTWHWYDNLQTCSDNCECIPQYLSPHPLAGWISQTSTFNTGCPNVPNKTLVTKQQTELEVFPNPAFGLINVKSKEEASLSISGINGKLVLQTRINAGENEIDVSDLPSGVYIVAVNKERRKLVIK